MKRSTALATAALMLASAATIAPAYADEADDLAPARVQRNWNGGVNVSGGARVHTRANTSNGYATQAPAPVVVTRPAATPVAQDADEDNGRRAARSERGWNSEQHEHHRWSREYELDPAEAGRIREAHRESDRHVTLGRDRDDYVPSYYTPRRHWWHSWW